MATPEGKKDILLRVDTEMKAWLDAEREASGRSLNWLVNHALKLWRDRLEKGRGNAAD